MKPMLEGGTAVGTKVERDNRVAHHLTEGGSLFILPTWLAVDQDTAVREALRVYCPSQSGKHAMTVDRSWSRAQLERVQLTPRAPAAWRRARIVEAARRIQQGRRGVIGAPSDPRWLRNMAENPDVVEDEAIRLWSRFLEYANAPRGLVIPGFEATLDDLLVVNRGAKTGRDRRWFADHWPAVVSLLCHQGKAAQEYRRVEKNRTAAIPIATRILCCQDDPACDKAAMFARRLPRYSHDTDINRLLAGGEPAIRWLVVNADHEDKGDLLRRVAREPAHARERMEFVVAAMRALARTVHHNRALYAGGVLLSRVLAGSGWNPGQFDPTVVGRGLLSVSADSLAVFAAVRRSGGEAEEASSVEIGVLALVELLAAARPRLTPRQLFRFLEYAESHAVHRVRSELPSMWPAPAGWSDVAPAYDSGRARIVPLLDSVAVKAEGERMSNCLRGGTFMRMELLTGGKALFSVQVGGDRATLALVATEQREASTIQVESWKMDAIRGPSNGPAPPSCEEAARALVEQLNRPLPVALSAAEVQRRREIGARVEGRHSFNEDVGAASARWKGYVRRLPKRFWSIEPSSVVDDVTR